MSRTNNVQFTIKPERYYNIAQLRTELWSELQSVAYRLSKEADNGSSELKMSFEKLINHLRLVEQYWAYPGIDILAFLYGCFKNQEYKTLFNNVSEVVRMHLSDSYRYQEPQNLSQLDSKKGKKKEPKTTHERKRYFEVLFVDNLSEDGEFELKQKLHEIRDKKDKFIYRVVVAKTFQDALIALQFNQNIQVAVIRYGIPFKSGSLHTWIRPFVTSMDRWDYSDRMESELSKLLGESIAELRPELDTYYVTDTPINQIPDDVLQNFRRIFFRREDLQELHLSIIRGIRDRYETPFFSALQEYSKKPTGVFHAMPISRGNSIFKSEWIDDFGEFYGRNLFLAETSSTGGGLDSLLQPTGPLKRAQELASKAFGSQHTFFATNGTSTSNKIVLQAIVEPGDVILIDRDCHKSHHYGMVLSGSYAVYLDSYPLEQYSMYGAVPLSVIKEKLLQLKKADRLDKVKMLLLTNCTFDGLVYNVEKVMEEVLAIKPDMIFLWDEAWFGFAAFTHTYRQRTGMYVAKKLEQKYASDEYKKTYQSHVNKIKGDDIPLMPDPEKVKIRVYATQSTHKTLSSMRQGSMIHIYDQEFNRKVHDSFHEAYMTHTSTSANYQILASLDAGRRQVSFEGYAMVEKSIEMAMILRSKINDHPKLSKYFKVLTINDIIPEEYRASGTSEYYDTDRGWNRMDEVWSRDDFVLDPTKITLHIGRTGVDGDTFKNKYLMDQFNIQINKTSRNTVLFMTNIGTTRSSVSYLISVLLKISSQLDEKFKALNKEELKIKEEKVYSLTEETPPLPHFSYFHDSFKAVPGVPGGNLRSAYFLAYKDKRCEYIKLEDCEDLLKDGVEIVSASFVIPYPPGFPILVPGQVMTKEILEFLIKLDVKEIHGYRPELGLKVFSQSALNRQKSASALMGAGVAAIGMGASTKKDKGEKPESTEKAESV